MCKTPDVSSRVRRLLADCVFLSLVDFAFAILSFVSHLEYHPHVFRLLQTLAS